MMPSVVRYYPKSRMPSWPHPDVPAEGPETNTEVLRNEKARNNSKSELVQNRLNDGPTDNAYDRTTIWKSSKFLEYIFKLKDVF